MTEKDGARPGPSRPDAKTNITRAEALVRAAARILARHHCPEWRPATDGELDAWGHGYGVGHRQGYADGGGQ